MAATRKAKEMEAIHYALLKAKSKRAKTLGKKLHWGLRRFNKQFIKIEDSKALNVEVKGASGRIIAGLTGETSYGWLSIWILWIDEKHRKKGIGRKLMAMAEKEAKRRGCKRAILWTMDFQAPRFYRKLGYRTQRTLKNYTAGYDSLTMIKSF